MESLNNSEKVVPIRTEAGQGIEYSKEKEYIFDTLILEEVINSFIEDLEEAGFEKEGIDQFLQEIHKYNNEEIKGILAIPKELREKNFKSYKDQVDSDELNIEDIVSKLRDIALKNGYTLGYHISKIDIEPKNNSWEIEGRELDDRDDMNMAYYSLDYKNFFRKNRGNKLYIVRAKTGENTEHKRDTSNNWGRAASLSIIHKINLTSLDEKIEAKIKENREQAKRDAA